MALYSYPRATRLASILASIVLPSLVSVVCVDIVLNPAGKPLTTATYNSDKILLFDVVDPPNDGYLCVMTSGSDDISCSGYFLLDLSNTSKTTETLSFTFAAQTGKEVEMFPLSTKRIILEFSSIIYPDYGDEEETPTAKEQVISGNNFVVSPSSTLEGSNIEDLTYNATASYVVIKPDGIHTRVRFDTLKNSTILFKSVQWSVEYDPALVVDGIQEYAYTTRYPMGINAKYPILVNESSTEEKKRKNCKDVDCRKH